MPNFFELLEVKIYPRFDEGLTEAGKCAVRLRTRRPCVRVRMVSASRSQLPSGPGATRTSAAIDAGPFVHR